jgi:hypothetical protein
MLINMICEASKQCAGNVQSYLSSQAAFMNYQFCGLNLSLIEITSSIRSSQTDRLLRLGMVQSYTDRQIKLSVFHSKELS